MTRLGRMPGSGRLYKLPGSSVWCLDWRNSRGQRCRQALSSDKRTAQRLRNEIISRRDLEACGLGTEAGQDRPLSEVMKLYVEDLRQRACEKHVVNVEARLGFVLQALRVKRVSEVKAIGLVRYRTELLSAGRSNRTVNCYLGALAAMLNWAVSAGLIAENPVRNFKPLPYREEHQTHVRRALSDAEIAAFLTAAEADDEEQAAYCAAEKTIASGTKSVEYAERRRPPRIPQAPLWRMLIECGSRWGETVATTWADLDREKLTMHLRAATTKSGRSRVIPLRADLVEELWSLRGIHQQARQRMLHPANPIFLTPDGAEWARETSGARRIFRRVLDRAGIAKRNANGVVDIHALRHSAASRMARHGVPLVVAARVLGHASVEMTSKIYTHLTTDDLRAAVSLAPRSRSRTA